MKLVPCAGKCGKTVEAKYYEDFEGQDVIKVTWCCKDCKKIREAETRKRMGFSGLVGTRRKPLVFPPDISSSDEVIKLQTEIIKEYKNIVSFINDSLMDVIRAYKDKPDKTEAETRVMNYAWELNDCLIDQPRLGEMLKKLNEQFIGESGEVAKRC